MFAHSSAEVVKPWTDPPQVLWKQPVGPAHSSPVVANGVVYAFYQSGRADDALAAFDAVSGKRLWENSYDRKPFSPPFGAGPRSTPTVDGDAVYMLGARGDLAGLDAATGQLRWQKNLVGDFGGRVMAQWGYCESPLVDGDKLVCCPGSEDGTVAGKPVEGRRD